MRDRNPLEREYFPVALLALVFLPVFLLTPWPPSAWAAGIAPMQMRQPNPDASPSHRLSEPEVLALAHARLNQGRINEAAALYQTLLTHARIQEYRTEAAFQLAGIYMVEGRFRQAIVMYLRILNHDPSLARVRLELARAYFLNRDYEDAQTQFELVKGGGLPPAVQDRVNRYLTQIRRVKDWTFDFGMTLVPDSNISQASGDEEECIAFGGLLLCRPLEKKRTGVGLSVGGSFNHYLHFDRDFGLRTTLSANALEYERNDFDDYQFFFASGPRLTFESGEVSVQPTFRKRWYGGRQYNEEYGARLEAQQIFGRFVFNESASWARSRYNISWIDSYLRGKIWGASGRIRYILNDRTFVQIQTGFQRETAQAEIYGSDSWRYALGLYRVFPWGFSLFTEGALTTTRYHDSQWYVTRDHRIGVVRRRDTIWQIFVSLASDLFEEYNVTPMLQYIYVRRNSNIWSHEYDRHRVNISFNYRF